MCSPNTILIERSSQLVTDALQGIGRIGTAASVLSDYKTSKDNYKYRTQVALNNAKMAQNEALKEKQLGIEKARLEKISGLQKISKMQAKNSASNLDMMSQTNRLAYQDALDYSNANANLVKSQHDLQAQNYFNQANSYLNQAQIYKKQYRQSMFDYTFNALGKYGQVASDWYQNRGEVL